MFVVETIGLAGAATGGLMSKTSWVDDFEKPSAWPDKPVLPLAWCLVNYPSIAIATWLVSRRRKESDVVPALAVTGMCIAHNALFGSIVNRAKNVPVYVLMDILGDCIGVAQAVSYGRISNRAVVVLSPYLAWLAYTTDRVPARGVRAHRLSA